MEVASVSRMPELTTALMQVMYIKVPRSMPYFQLTNLKTKKGIQLNEMNMLELLDGYPSAIKACHDPRLPIKDNIIFSHALYSKHESDVCHKLEVSIYNSKCYIFIKPLKFNPQTKQFAYTR